MNKAESIKQRILEQTGDRVPTDIPVKEALDPDSDFFTRDASPYPGDDDPSRVIESAECGMTFSDSEELALTPYVRKRLDEIAETE